LIPGTQITMKRLIGSERAASIDSIPTHFRKDQRF
jgi:hypothetical protein